MLYAETSAVLRWLLGQEHGEEVRHELERAERVIASCLTILECKRALSRLAPRLQADENATLRSMLFEAAHRWVLVEIDSPVRDRAGEPFPIEPVRALDAIHLATCVEVERAMGRIDVLSVDDRIRSNALRFGLRVVPEDAATGEVHTRRAPRAARSEIRHDADGIIQRSSPAKSARQNCRAPALGSPTLDGICSSLLAGSREPLLG